MFISLDVLSNDLDFKSITNSVEFCKQNKIIDLEDKEFINKLIENNKFYLANHAIVHMLSTYDCVKYALFAADEIIEYFENNFKNSLFRKTIEEIRSYVKDPDNVNLDCSYETLMDPTWHMSVPDLRHAAFCMVCTANTHRAKLSAISAIEESAYAQGYIAIKEIPKPKYINSRENYLRNNKYRVTRVKTIVKLINYGLNLL
jgi:hypothetical protein